MFRRGALRHPDFRRYLVAQLLWALASQMMTVAVGYQVYMLSRNPLDLALVGLSQFLPFVVLVLPAGHAADVFDRRRLLQLTYGVQAMFALAMTLVAISSPTSTGPIIALMTLVGVARAISLPTTQSIRPNLVDVEDYPNAVALSSTSFQIATIAGPAVGGILLLGGEAVVYGTSVVLLLIATAMALRLRRGGRSDGSPSKASLTMAGILSGVSFVRRQPLVLGAISLDMFAVLFGGAVALLPIYATDILHVGPVGLGLLRSAPAVGALIAALWLGIRPFQDRVGMRLFASVGAFGVAVVVFAVSTSFVVSIVALTFMGTADMVSVYIRNLVVQLSTPDAIRGRVSAINGVFVGASNELGDFESGITAAAWGAVTAAVVGGVMVIAVAVAWAVLFAPLLRMDRFPPPADVPPDPPPEDFGEEAVVLP